MRPKLEPELMCTIRAIKNRVGGYQKQNVCLFANAFANEAAASLRSFVFFLIFRVSFGPSAILDYCHHGSQGHERYESDEGKGWRQGWRHETYESGGW